MRDGTTWTISSTSGESFINITITSTNSGEKKTYLIALDWTFYLSPYHPLLGTICLVDVLGNAYALMLENYEWDNWITVGDNCWAGKIRRVALPLRAPIYDYSVGLLLSVPFIPAIEKVIKVHINGHFCRDIVDEICRLLAPGRRDIGRRLAELNEVFRGLYDL